MESETKVNVMILEKITSTELIRLIDGLINIQGFEFDVTSRTMIRHSIKDMYTIPYSLSSMCMPKSTKKLANLSGMLSSLSR